MTLRCCHVHTRVSYARVPYTPLALGAVGINLTAADHVFILEPCMNPALEDQ